METLIDDALLRQKRVHEKKPYVCSLISKEDVLEFERPGFWLPLRIRTWLAT